MPKFSKTKKRNQHSPRYGQSQAGMTMVEMLVSIAMIGGLIVLYAAAFNVAALTKKMRNENIAYHIASKKIEELRATPHASLPVVGGPYADPLLAQLPTGAAEFDVYNYLHYTNLKEFVVRVNWNDGVPRQVELKSLTGTGGINQ